MGKFHLICTLFKMGLFSPRSLAVFFDMLVLISLIRPPGVRTQGFCSFGLCQNGATCIETDNGGSCLCAEGFTGFICDGSQVSSLSCMVCSSYSYRDPDLAQQNIGLQNLDCENGILNGDSVTEEECMSNADSCTAITMDVIGDGTNGQPVRSVIRACSQAPSLTCVPPSGEISFFLSMELGITITDIQGKMCYCSDRNQCNDGSTIGPITTADPAFQFLVPCPSDRQVQVIPGQQEAVVTWQEPIVVDSQGNIVAATETLATRQSFPIGTTTITYRYSDSQGNSETCSFDITVQVNTPPSIPTCPTVLPATSLPENVGNLVTWTIADCTDEEDGNITSECDPMSNTFFNVGVNPVTCTCTDTLGVSTECTFDVVIAGGKTENSDITVIITAVSGVVLLIGVTCSSVSLFYCLCKNRSPAKERQPGKKEQPEPEVTYSRRIDKDYTDINGDRGQEYCAINSVGVEPDHSYQALDVENNPQKA